MYLKKQVYISTRKNELEYDEYGNQTAIFNTPKKYEFNVQPLSGELDVQEFGERVLSMQRAVISKDLYLDKFHEGDVAYLDGTNPNYETENGNNANYRICSVRNQNTKIILLFERLTGK